MSLADVFMGSAPSRFAAIAIAVALLAVGVAILASNDSVPLAQRFLFVLTLFLTCLPAILFTLLQMTCLVTGSAGGKKWWCAGMSWFASVVIMLYAVCLVFIAVVSIVGGRKIEEIVSQARAPVAGGGAGGGHEGFEDANQAAHDILAMADAAPERADAGMAGPEGFYAEEEQEEGAAHEGYANAPHGLAGSAALRASSKDKKKGGSHTKKEGFVDFPAYTSAQGQAQGHGQAGAVEASSEETFASFGAPVA